MGAIVKREKGKMYLNWVCASQLYQKVTFLRNVKINWRFQDKLYCIV